eukprot:2696962-Amphidinium_carterae.1
MRVRFGIAELRPKCRCATQTVVIVTWIEETINQHRVTDVIGHRHPRRNRKQIIIQTRAEWAVLSYALNESRLRLRDKVRSRFSTPNKVLDHLGATARVATSNQATSSRVSSGRSPQMHVIRLFEDDE